MRYAVARYKTQIRDTAYRNYVTDALFCVVNGGQLVRRYAEIFDQPEEKEDKLEHMTVDEVVDKVWSKIGG